MRPAILCALLGLLTIPAARCQPPAAPAPALIVAPENGVTTTPNGAAVFDAGTVDPQTTPHVDHTFTLRNAGTAPITVARLRGSCGCETLLLTKGGQTVKTTTLAAGESAEVQASVRTAGQPTGVLHKFLWVDGADTAAPLATIEIQFQVRPPVEAAPAFLNFGPVASGTARTLSLTVTADTAALPGGVLPALTSTGPAVTVHPTGPARSIQRDGRPALQQAYTVTLSNAAPAGRLNGTLRFTPSDPPVPALGVVSVPVVADITGHITALPKTVFFGSVVAGKSVTRQVLLNVATPEAGASPAVSGGAAWVTAAWQPAGPGGARVLNVTLSAQAPAGVLQTQLTITAGADRLILPVTADVVKP